MVITNCSFFLSIPRWLASWDIGAVSFSNCVFNSLNCGLEASSMRLLDIRGCGCISGTGFLRERGYCWK